MAGNITLNVECDNLQLNVSKRSQASDANDKSLIINGHLHKQIKLAAAEQGRTVRDVVEDLLATGLQQKTAA